MRTIALTCSILLFTACQGEAPPTETGAAPIEAQAKSTVEASLEPSTESERLNAWLDEKFEERVMMNPVWLTRLARKDRYDEFNDRSEAEADRQLQWLADSVADLKARFSYDALDPEAKTSWDLWVYQYEQARDAAAFRRSSYVFTQMLGPQSQVAQFLIRFHRVDDEADMAAYTKRIGGISRAVRQLLERAQVQAREGVRPPRFGYEGAIQEATNLITGAPFSQVGQDSPLWADAKKKVAALEAAGTIDATTAETLRADARAALLEDFAPSYAGLIEWLNTDMDNVSPTARGVGSLPNGAAYYQHRLQASTTTDLTAEEIHEIGLAEVARIQAEMDAIREQVGFEGDLRAFFAFVKNDPRFQYPNTDDGRQGYLDDSDAYLSFINKRLSDYFGILPKAGLVVRRVEAFREQDGAPQHYSLGAPDGSRPGVYYAHLSDMSSMPKHLMEAIAYHEGNPGHHMQISIAQESESVPRFRTQVGFTAFSEGWGLYAELLAKEMGAYEDPYSDFGRLTTEIWRAVRLVVDTGIHARGWSEEGAITYFRDNSAVADGAIKAEVRRYFAWPGQATAYKIGMLKILELRHEAEAALGEKFDIRAFHDTVIGSGALPLHILERRVDEWVATQG
jgi:uncharacterized protein (DUF885 family)